MDISSLDNTLETVLGNHLILDITVEDSKIYILQSIAELAKLLRDAALKTNATILKSEWHHFGGNHGVTGVILLAESHISIHSWPEYNYLAIDIFMCGECDPLVSTEYIQNKLKPIRCNIKKIERGI